MYTVYIVYLQYTVQNYREETAREDNGQIKWEKINNCKRKEADK